MVFLGGLVVNNDHQSVYWGFHKWGYPNSWMVYKGKTLVKWMIWGYPYFRKLPYHNESSLTINRH